MSDNTTLRNGRPDSPYFSDQLDAVTESDGAGGWQLKTSGGGGGGGSATAANQVAQISVAANIGIQYEIREERISFGASASIPSGYILGAIDGSYTATNILVAFASTSGMTDLEKLNTSAFPYLIQSLPNGKTVTVNAGLRTFTNCLVASGMTIFYYKI